MAAKEINTSTPMKSEKSKNLKYTTTAKQYLDSAYDKLLFKEFQGCIRTCETGIVHAKLEVNGNPDIVEALCIVGIQAYAELNHWQKVLPFVQNVYNSIEDCPFRVVQLCILLHAKVGEYSQCYVIASIWLKAAKNFSDVNYVSLVEIYIVNILLPRNERNRIDSFLDACPGLSSSQRKRMCTEYVETTTQVGTSAQNIDTGRLTREIISKQKATVVKDSWLLSVIKKVKFALFGSAPVYSFSLVKFTIIAVCLYLISFGHQRGFLTSNFAKVGVLFEGFIKVFKSLFAPNSYIMR